MKAIITEEALNKCTSQSKFNQEEFQNKLTAVIHHFGLDLQTCKLSILYTICPQTLEKHWYDFSDSCNFID